MKLTGFIKNKIQKIVCEGEEFSDFNISKSKVVFEFNCEVINKELWKKVLVV